jgi:predicted ATP-dependent endonuclease of OLD family
MIDKMDISHFRGIEKLNLNEMKRISVLSGKNNVGKTTVLESLFFLFDHSDPNPFAPLNAFRGSALGGPVHFWEPLFYQMDVTQPINISVYENGVKTEMTLQKDDNYLPYRAEGVPDEVLARFRTSTRGTYSLKFKYISGEYLEEGHFCADGDNVLREVKTNQLGNEQQAGKHARYLHASMARISDFIGEEIGKLELSGRKHEIIEILQYLDPTIEDITMITRQGVTQLYTRIRNQWIPLQYAGDGVLKLLNICFTIMEQEKGLVLIDEIDSGLHYSMYRRIWEIIGKYSKEKDCQLVVTTHNKEMIEALLETKAEIQNETNIYTLYKKEDKTLTRKMSAKEAEKAIDYLGMELR